MLKTDTKGDEMLVAENLADDAVLISAIDGKVLHRYQLSAGKYVPSAMPYGAVVTRDGKIGWVSLWNSSTVAKLDLFSDKVLAADFAGTTGSEDRSRHRIPRPCC